MKKTVRLNVPVEALRILDAELSPEEKANIHLYIYPIHAILEQHTHMHTDAVQHSNGFVIMHSDFFSKVIGNGDRYSPILDRLKEHNPSIASKRLAENKPYKPLGLVKCNESYLPESASKAKGYSKGYALADHLLTSPIQAYYVKDTGFYNRINQLDSAGKYKPQTKVERYLKKQLKSFSTATTSYTRHPLAKVQLEMYKEIYNYIAVLNATDELNPNDKIIDVLDLYSYELSSSYLSIYLYVFGNTVKAPDNVRFMRCLKTDIFDNATVKDILKFKPNRYLPELRLIDLITEGKANFSRARECRRLFSSFAGSSRLGRRWWVHESGQKLYALDVANSQPLILCTLFPNKLTTDMLLYKQLCEYGKFYEYLFVKAGYDLATMDEETRAWFKVELFREVYYGEVPKSFSWCPLAKLFAKQFPSVWELIKQEKAERHEQLAINMQRSEAHLVIDVVCRWLLQEYNGAVPVITIHDSIVTTDEWKDVVKAKMEEAFKIKHDLSPLITAKKLMPDNFERYLTM
jgi:hypothetical protein